MREKGGGLIESMAGLNPCRQSASVRELCVKMKMLWAGAKTTEATTDHSIPFHLEFAAYIFQPLTPEFWIV